MKHPNTTLTLDNLQPSYPQSITKLITIYIFYLLIGKNILYHTTNENTFTPNFSQTIIVQFHVSTKYLANNILSTAVKSKTSLCGLTKTDQYT